MKILRSQWVGILLLAAMGSSCNDHAPIRDGNNAQNAAFTTARWAELEPAAGTYKGVMRMTETGNEYACTLILTRMLDLVTANGTPVPTETIQVPKLYGTLMFDAMANETDNTKFEELLYPLGHYWKMVFDYADYNTSTHSMVLPYTVSSYNKGPFGQLFGRLESGEFVGSWNSRYGENVGEFTLRRVTDDGKCLKSGDECKRKK
ncbi:hypothetical protein K2X30_13670 [bacterium]|nr:hypothetical protein [bacterium]